MDNLSRQSKSAGDARTTAEIVSTMRALPMDALSNFFRLPDTDLEHGPGSGCIIFNCAISDGGLIPLKSKDREHPLWRHVLEAAGSHITPGAALSLQNHLVLSMDGGRGQPARIIIITDAAILDASLLPGAGYAITSSELRVLKQLLCGFNLSEAAARDTVGHETKRSQFKSLCRKIGVHSQNELTRTILIRVLLNLVAISLRPSDSDRLFTALCRQFIPEARTFLLSGSGTDQRFIDVGPVSGTPVIFLHSLILPDLRAEDMSTLDRHGVRLIIPLRNGAMASAFDKLTTEEHLDHACEGIDLVRSHFGLQRVNILPCVSGSAYGIEYARRYPDKVRSLAFAGACVTPDTGRTKARRQRESMFTFATRPYGKHIQHTETLRNLLLDIYRPSLADLAIIEAEYAPPHGGERMRKLFSSSMESLKHDFYHQAYPRWEVFPHDSFPSCFLHGIHDLIHPLGEVRKLAHNWGDAPIHLIQGGGQLLYHRHFEPLLAGYRAFLDKI